MPMPKNLNELIELFRKLGANDPASWATSQISEGFNQLHRFLFLREAWKGVESESDDTWIDAIVKESEKNPDAPYSGMGHAMSRMLEKNVDREDIVDLVRGAQASTLFNTCYILDCPELEESELQDMGWALAEVTINEANEFVFTGKAINALYESVLSLDPTGREMRPRPVKKAH